jgi:hypothetical protein
VSGVKSKSVRKEQKIVEDEFLEDGEMFKNEEKFWEEMNLNKEKRKMEVKEEKMDKEEKIDEEQKMEVEEEKMEVEEQKPEVKKQCTSLHNKYKRKREGDEDTGKYNIYIRRRVFLDTSNIHVNFFKMMRRHCMRSSKTICLSSLDITSHWKE